MATPLTPDQFVNALRAEGVRVVTVGEWRTHNRNHKGAWGPVNGIIQHHTVSSGDQSSVSLCYDGYAGLPGPLCHGVITKDGTVHVISVGRANHAGGGDPNVLQAVIDERYNETPPKPLVGNTSGVDGNARFYGFECVNLGNGKDPWPPAQVEAMVRASAALCRAHGWTEKSTIAHREWSRDKSDPLGPGMPTMPQFRAKIAERLAHSPSWDPNKPGGTDTPTPTEQGSSMAPNRSTLLRTEDLTLLQDNAQTLYWTTEYADDGNEHGAGGKTVLDGGQYSAVVSLKLEGLKADETVEVYAVEEDANGYYLGQGPQVTVQGLGDGTDPVYAKLSFMGFVWNRLTFRIVSRQASAVVYVRDAQLDMQSWPN